MSQKFKAVVIDNQNEKFTREIKEIDTSHLKDGNVLVKIDYSSLNYKDALILNNGGKIVRKFPFVPGIDFSGTVVESEDNKFKKDIMYLEKKEINHATIKVSWIKEPDKSVSLTDIMTENGKPRDHGWACGASAGYVAIHREKPDEVYLIGHDLHSATDKVNNLYKGTKHYVAPENGPTPAVNWINQWYTLADWNPNVKFIKVNRFNDGRDLINGPIKEWNERKNITYTDYSTLDNLV